MEQKVPIAKKVASYVRGKPYVREAVEQGIVNFSALARKIGHEMPRTSKVAIKAALLREARKLSKKRKNREKAVISLLRNSKFSIRNKMAAVRSKEPLRCKPIAYSKTPSGYVYFLDEDDVAGQRALKKLSIIHIKSSNEIVELPGVAAFILSSLAEEGINVFHMMDCREDTFLVVSEADAPFAFKVLAERLRL